MNVYDYEVLSTVTSVNFGDLLKTPEQVDVVITGYIELKRDDFSALAKLMKKISEKVPQSKWLEYFLLCVRYATSSETSKEMIQDAENFVKVDKISKSKTPQIFFLPLEELYIANNRIFDNSNLLRITAGFAFDRTKDTRYKLFRDYAYIYTSEDKDELIDAVNQLETHLNSCVCDRDKRSIFYIQCLAIMRILRVNKPFDVTEDRIEGVYKDCLEKKHDWYSSSDDCFKKYYLFGRMKKYNCPEVARIFENTDMYVDADFSRNLHKAVRRTLDNNKYSSEKPPIVSEKIVFLSKEMIDPDFSPW